MAEFVIKNGASGDTAFVDANQNLHVQAVTETQSDHAGDYGYKLNVNTGDITLTDATVTTCLFVKNTGDDDVIITDFIYNLGNSTNGTGDAKIDIIRNPTAGDIVTNANNTLIGNGVEANLNFGSTITFPGVAYKGATSEAPVTDGSVCISTRSAASTGRIFLSLGALALPKGTSVAVNYTPPASNSSQIVQFAMASYVRTNKVAVL